MNELADLEPNMWMLDQDENGRVIVLGVAYWTLVNDTLEIVSFRPVYNRSPYFATKNVFQGP